MSDLVSKEVKVTAGTAYKLRTGIQDGEQMSLKKGP